MNLKPKFRRKKGWRHQPEEAPFPVPIQSITGKPACDTRWFYYEAELVNGSVLVQKEGDGHFLYKMGFFGKGNLSRGKPEHVFFSSSFQGHQRKSLPASERRFQQSRFQKVRQHRYQRHLSWKKMKDREVKSSKDAMCESSQQPDPTRKTTDNPFALSGNEQALTRTETGSSVALKENETSASVRRIMQGRTPHGRIGVVSEGNDMEYEEGPDDCSDDETSGIESESLLEGGNDKSEMMMDVDRTPHVEASMTNLTEKERNEALNGSKSSSELLKEKPVPANVTLNSTSWEVNMDDWTLPGHDGSGGERDPSCVTGGRSSGKLVSELRKAANEQASDARVTRTDIWTTDMSDWALPQQSSSGEVRSEDVIPKEGHIDNRGQKEDSSDSGLQERLLARDLGRSGSVEGQQGRKEPLECDASTIDGVQHPIEEDEINCPRGKPEVGESCEGVSLASKVDIVEEQSADMPQDVSRADDDDDGLEVSGEESGGQEDDVGITKKDNEQEGHALISRKHVDQKLASAKAGHPTVVRKPDPFPIQEFLQLSYEEAFFLSYGLGCLSLSTLQKGSRKAMDICDMWREFRNSKPRFIATYACYHYYRSKGWVPRCGIKYGCDFVIYKQGPTFYHSSFAVLAQLVPTDSSVTSALTSWASFTGFSRIVENSAKDVLICFVICPADFTEEQLQSPACIPHLKVKEVSMKRWRPTRERERKDYSPLIS